MTHVWYTGILDVPLDLISYTVEVDPTVLGFIHQQLITLPLALYICQVGVRFQSTGFPILHTY